MSRKCDHDWFDHYMMYSMMNNTGNTGGGGNDWGCLLIILACIPGDIQVAKSFNICTKNILTPVGTAKMPPLEQEMTCTLCWITLKHPNQLRGT